MRRRTPGDNGITALKIDISKAYDRLEWSFVLHMMNRFGFHEIWMDRVMKFISSTSYSFVHNGELYVNVILQFGFRQGDPVSAFLYIMCAEGFSVVIRRNESAGLLRGCAIAKSAPIISHLLFTNDCYFFFKTNESEADMMKKILNRYERASGQMVNFDKSLFTFSSNQVKVIVVRRNACNQLGVREASTPGWYLGLPIGFGRNKTTKFGFVLERIEQKLQGWVKYKILKAGVMTLIERRHCYSDNANNKLC
ncbi:uncharacterized protein LOC135149441 [Daucus carota subsp. sativus]|uniref:uncharacterized protein LOC135149441 n=1 Tax=Daucus carota subsp. sativus TaxID=79200 RepID=UPI003082F97C